jgi:hypothetical protein
LYLADLVNGCFFSDWPIACLSVLKKVANGEVIVWKRLNAPGFHFFIVKHAGRA